MPPGKKPTLKASAPTQTAKDDDGDKTPTNASNVKGYKPPWIKEAAEPNKETETPWGIMKKRDAVNDPEEIKKQQKAAASKRVDDDDEDTGANFAIPALRKVSLKTDKVENGESLAQGKEPTTFVKPQLKSVRKKERAAADGAKPIVREESKSKIVIPKLNSVKVEKMKELPPPPKKDQPDYRNVLKKVPTKDRIDDEKKRGAPMAPPMPPMPPPPPAMPKLIDTGPLSGKQKVVLDNLRSRPKTRPDWTAVLKGIESGAKLKHVETNDRSRPLLPKGKAKGQFLYESEKDNAHNVLLKEIQLGVHLKKVKTNDRSKPVLEGLRKFRRQMTIEEQIQKSMSMASMAGAAPGALQNNPSMASIAYNPSMTNIAYNPSMTNIAYNPSMTNIAYNPSMSNIAMTNMPDELAAELDDEDELDDIDRVRDDLQSTKQLLAIEMRNKEQIIRENKRLQSRINNLEKDRDENQTIAQNEKEADKRREPDEKLIVTLKAEAAEARKKNEDLEKKLTQTAKELDNTKYELEEMKRRNSELEKRLQEYMIQGKRYSVADRRDSQMVRDDDGGDENSDEESEEEESEEKRAKRAARELKMLVNKLRSFKNKVDNAKKERVALKEIMKGHQGAIREEKKKFKTLQKEVNKMAALMKESDSDEEDEDEDEAEEEESSEEETTESETESSDTESESERSQSEPEDAPIEKKKENVVARSRRHENRLGALKKTNFMLKTNAERLQDDLNQQKEMTASLQNDLDSVLAELG